MASVSTKNGFHRIYYRYLGKQYTYPVGKVSTKEANLTKSQVETLLLRVDQGLREVPPGMEFNEFIRHDGKPPLKPQQQVRKDTRLIELRSAYLDAHSRGGIEANTLATLKIHLNHISATLTPKFLLAGLDKEQLQNHINRRQDEGISPITVKKELDSFRTMWRWGQTSRLVSGDFPSAGLVYSKTDEKLPYLSLVEAAKRIKAEANEDVIREAIYLNLQELKAFLQHAKNKKSQPWVWPMIATAAYTGMRRSELIRIKTEDVDLKSRVITVKEKKRAKGVRTTRRVAINDRLLAVLKPFMKKESAYLFGNGIRPLTVQAAHKVFERIVAKSKWSLVRGWHTLRHSWISIMASAGADQRIIDDSAGHSTEQQRRRYRHLFPHKTYQAVNAAFA